MTTAKFGSCWSNDIKLSSGPTQKFGPSYPTLQTFKVIINDTLQSGTYDFLLVINWNYVCEINGDSVFFTLYRKIFSNPVEDVDGEIP